MGVTKQIPRSEWKAYFDRFTLQHLRDEDGLHKVATIEVLSQAIGDQYDADVVRLMGLTYDPKSNIFEVLLDDVDHLVFQPDEIWVIEDENDGFVSTLEVVRSDATKEIIHVRPSAVPAPSYDDVPPPSS